VLEFRRRDFFRILATPDFYLAIEKKSRLDETASWFVPIGLGP